MVDIAEVRLQWKLSAILAADVVGYSRLTREDETGTLVPNPKPDLGRL